MRDLANFKGFPSHQIILILYAPNREQESTSSILITHLLCPRFLKRTILPKLVETGEIRKVVVRKEVTAPVHKMKKGRIAQKVVQGTGNASPENPAEVPAWVWKPSSEEERSSYLSQNSPSQPRQTLNETIENHSREDLHLNRRRRNQRG